MRVLLSVPKSPRVLAAVAGCLALALAAAVPPPAHAFDTKAAEKSTVRVLIGKDGKLEYGGHGTGFVVDDDHIVTNQHVAEPDSYVKEKKTYKLFIINPYVKDWMEAEIVWTAKELDLAVLRVKGHGLPAAELTTREPLTYPAKAQGVNVVGYPGVSDQMMLDPARKNIQDVMRIATVTRGNVGRTINATIEGKLRPIIQHDAVINQGNSGGPLFDNCNRVVGVNTFAAVSIIKVVKDDKGQQYAVGQTRQGAFYSPHISNLIEAARTVSKLKDVRVRLSSAECGEAEAGTSPVMIALMGVTLLIALGAAGLVMFRRREVVRVVESYSAWIKRKGVQPGAPRTDSAVIARSRVSRPAARVAAAAAAPGDWTLTGTDSKQNPIALSFSKEELEAAAAKSEKGLVIGRSTSLADKTIDEQSVSRRHAKLTLTDAGLAIEDLKSAYGVAVNGHKLDPFQPVIVEPGDQVVLGAVTLVLGRG